MSNHLKTSFKKALLKDEQRDISKGPIPHYSADRETPEEVINNSIHRVNEMRQFTGGATRNTDEGKLDYEGFLSPLALEAYAKYLHNHRTQANGKQRNSDNWQKGIPLPVYMKSMWRHFVSVWKLHRGWDTDETMDDALCGLLFNVNGYLHERLKAREQTPMTDAYHKRAAELKNQPYEEGE